MRYSHNLQVTLLLEESLSLINHSDLDCSVKHILCETIRSSNKLSNMAHGRNFTAKELLYRPSQLHLILDEDIRAIYFRHFPLLIIKKKSTI